MTINPNIAYSKNHIDYMIREKFSIERIIQNLIVVCPENKLPTKKV